MNNKINTNDSFVIKNKNNGDKYLSNYNTATYGTQYAKRFNSKEEAIEKMNGLQSNWEDMWEIVQIKDSKTNDDFKSDVKDILKKKLSGVNTSYSMSDITNAVLKMHSKNQSMSLDNCIDRVVNNVKNNKKLMDSKMKDVDWDFMHKIRDIPIEKLKPILKQVLSSKLYRELENDGFKTANIANWIDARHKELILKKLKDSKKTRDAKQTWKISSYKATKYYKANSEDEAVKNYMKEYPDVNIDDIYAQLVRNITNTTEELISKNMDSKKDSKVKDSKWYSVNKNVLKDINEFAKIMKANNIKYEINGDKFRFYCDDDFAQYLISNFNFLKPEYMKKDSKKDSLKTYKVNNKIIKAKDEFDAIRKYKRMKDGNLGDKTLVVGQKVKLDPQNLDTKTAKELINDDYVITGFYYKNQLVNKDPTIGQQTDYPYFRRFGGIQIKNLRTGAKFDVNRFQLKDSKCKDEYVYRYVKTSKIPNSANFEGHCAKLGVKVEKGNYVTTLYGDKDRVERVIWDFKLKDSIKDEATYSYIADPISEKQYVDKARQVGCKLAKLGGNITITGTATQLSKVFNMPPDALEKASQQTASALKKVSDSKMKDALTENDLKVGTTLTRGNNKITITKFSNYNGAKVVHYTREDGKTHSEEILRLLNLLNKGGFNKVSDSKKNH